MRTSSWKSAASCGRAGTKTPSSWIVPPASCDPDKVHRIDQEAAKSRGLLNVCANPIGVPPSCRPARRAGPELPRATPTRCPPSAHLAGAKALYDDIKRGVVEAGRPAAPARCCSACSRSSAPRTAGPRQAGRTQRARAHRGRSRDPVRSSRLICRPAARHDGGPSHRSQAAAHADALPLMTGEL